jgi:hypothetical protein
MDWDAVGASCAPDFPESDFRGLMPLPTAGQHGEKRLFIGVSTSPTGTEHSARNVALALNISHGPNDSRDRPAIVTIERKRRRKRVELTNAIFEYIVIFHSCSIDTWCLA